MSRLFLVTELSDVTSRDVDNALSSSTSGSRLESFIEQLERKTYVTRSDPYAMTVEQGARSIVHKIANAVGKADHRFQGEVLPSGSFYEDLKVGNPDEFDYTLLLTGLSSPGVCEFSATEEHAFLNVRLVDGQARANWDHCVSEVCPKHGVVLEKGVCNFGKYHANHERVIKDSHQPTGPPDRTLDPTKVQATFRELVNRVLPDVNLPSGWEHGGNLRPIFSGHRKHGPATMLQFIYRTADTELKVNLDITVGIKVDHALPFPQLERHSTTSVWARRMLRLQTQTPLYVIPLYSKMLLSEGKYHRKNAWRISCSPLENKLFEELRPTSPESRAIRVLKALRDAHLTYFQRKTKRQKDMSQVKFGDKYSRQARTHAWVHDPSFGEKCTRPGATTGIAHCGFQDETDSRDDEAWGGSEASIPDSKTTDLTVLLDPATAQLQGLLLDHMGVPKYSYQNTDIGFTSKPPGPGSGEYWGPMQYISSIEIKMLILRYLIEHGRIYEPLHLIVLRALLHFKDRMARNEPLSTSIYFGGPVCTKAQRQKATEGAVRLTRLLRDLLDVARGEKKHFMNIRID